MSDDEEFKEPPVEQQLKKVEVMLNDCATTRSPNSQRTYLLMIKDTIKDTPPCWTFVGMSDDVSELRFTLTGAEPPYDNRVFNVTVTYSGVTRKNFPFGILPSIHFEDQVYHCNIDEHGFMRFIDESSASTKLNHILGNVLCNLSNPDPDCLTNENACLTFMTDRDLYDALAVEVD